MATSYADSAQAREWDKRFDELGRPRTIKADAFHEYDAEAVIEHAQAYRKDLARRIGITMAQMEMVCPPKGGSE